MTLKVEVSKIPNSNSNHVKTYDEQNLNGQIKKHSPRDFVVPEEKTDEFVKKFSKQDKSTSKKAIACALTGMVGFGALGLHLMQKYRKLFLDAPVYMAFGGAILTGVIPYFMDKSKEDAILKEFNAQEIKVG